MPSSGFLKMLNEDRKKEEKVEGGEGGEGKKSKKRNTASIIATFKDIIHSITMPSLRIQTLGYLYG